MSEYGTRLKYEMIAKYLNDHGVEVDSDGDLYLSEDNGSTFYIALTGPNTGPPIQKWTVHFVGGDE